MNTVGHQSCGSGPTPFGACTESTDRCHFIPGSLDLAWIPSPVTHLTARLYEGVIALGHIFCVFSGEVVQGVDDALGAELYLNLDHLSCNPDEEDILSMLSST